VSEEEQAQKAQEEAAAAAAKAAQEAQAIAAKEAETRLAEEAQAAEQRAAEQRAAEQKAAEEAAAAAELARREKWLGEVDQLRAALEGAMGDVKNPKQFVAVNKTLKQLLAHPLFEGDASGQTGEVEGISELVRSARELIKKLERMWTLKKAIQDLNQKTIAEIKSFQIPLEEIEHVMRAVFLLLGDAPSEISAWKGIKVAIGRTGKKSLKRRILEFVPSNPLPKASLVQARKLMDGVAVDRITEVSQGTTVFYAWVSGVLDEMENKN
jgi:hypothetical protein